MNKERTTLKRAAGRGHHDKPTIYDILDASFICHVGYSQDGYVSVIPIAYLREGDNLYLHGSTANRMLRALRDGAEGCISVTHLDGIVLARSAFHHSVNYRSVVIFGKAEEIVDKPEKDRLLQTFVDFVIPGRNADVRPPNEQEILRTMVLKVPLDEASAKVRVGNPIDDEEDMDRDCWAGVLPLALVAGEPIADSKLKNSVAVPPYLQDFDVNMRKV